MIDTVVFGNALRAEGFDFFTGVPCSHLQPLINDSLNSKIYMMSVNEGDAVALAAGAFLGGKRPIVLMQNSGLTNAVSPLTSLNYTFKIPVLGFVSLRGEAGISDEPQHELMGQITTQMLELMQVEWEYLATNLDEALAQIQRADAVLKTEQPFFFVVKKDTFSEVDLDDQALPQALPRLVSRSSKEATLPSRFSVLQSINTLKTPDTVVLATTGKTGRELYTVEDSEQYLYMVGSMGCVSAVGMGLAIAKPSHKVIAIDGDGALMMRLGIMATNAAYHPANLLHIVLDNNTHDSTGGQFTVSHNVDFVQVAESIGYPKSIGVSTLGEFNAAVTEWIAKPTLTFLYLKTAKGSIKELGRPKTKPFEVKERLCRYLGVYAR